MRSTCYAATTTAAAGSKNRPQTGTGVNENGREDEGTLTHKVISICFCIYTYAII